MRVLVAYASDHGATAGIAERIAERLRADGLDVELAEASAARDPASFDACVIGSAVYIGRWRKAALAFVNGHRDSLAMRPVWLFSSGPLGDEPLDEQGRDRLETAVPEVAPELVQAVGAREHKVFFGALNPDDLPLIPRLMRLLPAGRRLLAEGDFRDWPEIDAWADSIAAALAAPAPAASQAVSEPPTAAVPR